MRDQKTATASERRLVAPQEMADLLGISVRTLRTMTAREEIPFRRVGRMTRFLIPDDLDAYLEAVAVPSRDREGQHAKGA